MRINDFDPKQFWKKFWRWGFSEVERKGFDEFCTSYLTTVCVDDFHEVQVEYVHNIEACNDIGVWSVEAKVDENGDHTYLDKRQARNILSAIEMVEENLLLIGVPFIINYRFANDGRGRKARLNEANRRKADIDGHIKYLEEQEEKARIYREKRKKAMEESKNGQN